MFDFRDDAAVDNPDVALREVVTSLRDADPDGGRTSRVLRATFDQLYDGQRTGRFRWEQLYKTEKTHFGTLIEINIRREFDGVIADGRTHGMDFRIAGHDIDCKYSQKDGGWMLPPECFEELLLVATANDTMQKWSLGVVRARATHLRAGGNRDGKTGLNASGRAAIVWLHRDSPLPPNVLLQLPDRDLQEIFSSRSGQRRINQLFRLAQNRRIGRASIATVAQQDDFMKRVRYNGGARDKLAWEGIIIPGGDYEAHRRIARDLGALVPNPGEVVSLRVAPALPTDTNTVELDGRLWRLATQDDPIEFAPMLPSTKRHKPDPGTASS